MNKKVILFYKRLVSLGGAENLLFNHYDYLISNNIKCEIVTFKNELDRKNPRQIIEVKNIIGLILFLNREKHDLKIIGSSGHIELFFGCLLSFNDFNYLIHQPSSMSYNEFDKYAFNNLYKLKNILNIKTFNKFKKLKYKIKPFNKLAINLRYILSYISIKKAKNVFVLSDFAKKEKKILYDIDAIVSVGAIYKILPLIIKNKNKDIIRIISLSRLDKNKRIKLILIALSNIHNKNIFLDIYGEGPEERRLHNLIKNLGLSKQVKLKGFLSEKNKKIFNNYDFSICIDFADFRITSIESINYSCPVIVSNETSIAHSDNFNFFYLCEPNVFNLKHTINTIINSNVNWSNRDIFLKNYLWKNYFNKINEYCL